MSIAIIQKAYEDVQAKVMAITTLVRYVDLDKFALQTFSRLVYKREVSGYLVASYLLSLPNHYSHDIKLRCINLNFICHYFISIIFHGSSIFQSSKDNATFTDFVQPLKFIFKYYQSSGAYLSKFCLYAYFVTILIVKYIKSSE